MAVYLLHFSAPVCVTRPARHYLGYADDGRVETRLREHRTGQGARITAAASARGIELTVVRVWVGATRHDERRLKRRKEAPRMCPLCRGTGRGR